MTDLSTDEFITMRDEALLSLDEEKICALAKVIGINVPSDKETFWIGIHKARCHATEYPEGAKQFSRDWLKGHNSSGDMQCQNLEE